MINITKVTQYKLSKAEIITEINRQLGTNYEKDEDFFASMSWDSQNKILTLSHVAYQDAKTTVREVITLGNDDLKALTGNGDVTTVVQDESDSTFLKIE